MPYDPLKREEKSYVEIFVIKGLSMNIGISIDHSLLLVRGHSNSRTPTKYIPIKEYFANTLGIGPESLTATSDAILYAFKHRSLP